MQIRTLREDEIECRVQTVKETGCSILLYKDARCDMRILDETFGVFGWQRRHELVNGNLFCTVSIWDNEKKMWIEKQDVGVESNTEKEKGQASDSFKRACFNIGIGRELYTAPFIWINLTKNDIFKQNNGKIGVRTKFFVSKIAYNDKREIIALEIKDEKDVVRYTFGKQQQNKPQLSNQENKPKPEVSINWKAFWGSVNSLELTEQQVHVFASQLFKKQVSSLKEVIATQEQLNKFLAKLREAKNSAKG